MMHRPGVANFDINDLSQNPCISQADDNETRWHGDVYEEMLH